MDSSYISPLQTPQHRVYPDSANVSVRVYDKESEFGPENNNLNRKLSDLIPSPFKRPGIKRNESKLSVRSNAKDLLYNPKLDSEFKASQYRKNMIEDKMKIA